MRNGGDVGGVIRVRWVRVGIIYVSIEGLQMLGAKCVRYRDEE